MNTPNPLQDRLSHITTHWDELIAAHDEARVDSDAATMRGEMLKRYSGCAYQYILGATKNPHAAEDLSQEFALRFVRGDFRNASPVRGRFRDYLKVSLRNLVTDFFRSKTNEEDFDKVINEQAHAVTLDSLESTFSQQWRQRVLGITWNALKEFESGKQTQYYTVLLLRTQHPNSSSEELASIYSQQADKQVTSDWIRQTLRRARLKFSELLTKEIGKTLNSNSKQEIGDELADLGLKKYIDGNHI